jgi:hypothetical protein
MKNNPHNEFIKVNRILGKQASIGPIPAEQLGPWIPHSAPQTVPEGNYGDEKSKLA